MTSSAAEDEDFNDTYACWKEMKELEEEEEYMRFCLAKDKISEN